MLTQELPASSTIAATLPSADRAKSLMGRLVSISDSLPDICINGFINHYPDFIIYTEQGNIILLETKGEQLSNDDSKDKLALGTKWADKAGDKFHYFMV